MIRRQVRRLYSTTAETVDFSQRRAAVKDKHREWYPTLLQGSYNTEGKVIRIPRFRQLYSSYEFPKENKIDELYVLNGRISSIRKSGKGMIFMDVVQDFEKLQIVASNRLMQLQKNEFAEIHDGLRVGDSVSCVGNPGVTNVGELSIKVCKPLRILSPSLHLLPPKLTDRSKINSNRVMDYLVNNNSQQVIIARAKIISTLRNFLTDLEFIEVETPVIGGNGTGANAQPFITTSNHIKDPDGLKIPLHLRVAPELWLKKLIISGFDKVFEIGKVFRNEGLDSTHNPEFTTCEFYQTFTTLDELMEITESIFLKILNKLILDKKLNLTHEKCAELLTLIQGNGNKFAKLEFIPTIESQTGKPLPSSLTSETLSKYYNEIQLEQPTIKSPQQYLDKLSSTYIEPLCQSVPTFIYNQPSLMSPLAKSEWVEYGDRTYLISRRFELFIHGKEYVNSYEEENNPFQQELNFQLQQSSRVEYKDEESIVPDYKFVEDMELGMSPTGGWGLGIDRLVMLLTGNDRIESVITFGKLNDVLKQ